MIEIDQVPETHEVSEFSAAYITYVEALTKRKSQVVIDTETLKHFIVATSICKRYLIAYPEFLGRLTKKHRKMTPNKIVPPHQLSTEYAEEAAVEVFMQTYNNDPRSKAEIDASLAADIPLDLDLRYQNVLNSTNYDAADCYYALERMNLLKITPTFSLADRFKTLKRAQNGRIFKL